MARDLTGEVVVITGASAGIGAALADELGRRRARLVLVARRREKLEEVARRAGGEAEVVVADVTRRDDVRRALDAALARFGRVDAWVNNAGRGITRPLEALTDDDVDAMVRDNVKSALYGMQAVLPHFKERRRGVLVNVSSMLGRVPFVTARSAYSAAKAMLGSLGDTLRFEVARELPDVRVIQVFPGVVATEFGNNALGGGPDSRALPGAQPVEEVARMIADAIRDGGPADLYTRPEQLDALLGHLRTNAGAKGK